MLSLKRARRLPPCVEQLIVDAIAKAVAVHDPVSACGTDEVNLPVLRSLRPGMLGLSGFDFDDLLT